MSLLSLLFSFLRSWVACRVSPRRARYFSLLRQRKVPKRKATLVSVTPAVPGQPAMLAPGGSRANSLRSNMRVSDSACRCASRHSHKGVENQQPGPTRTRHGASLLNSVFGPHRRVRRRVAQERADKGARMFERSEFARTPPGPSTAACPALQRRDDAPGSPFFASFLWRDKERKSPAGARPGNAALQAHGQKEASPTC